MCVVVCSLVAVPCLLSGCCLLVTTVSLVSVICCCLMFVYR